MYSFCYFLLLFTCSSPLMSRCCRSILLFVFTHVYVDVCLCAIRLARGMQWRAMDSLSQKSQSIWPSSTRRWSSIVKMVSVPSKACVSVCAMCECVFMKSKVKLALFQSIRVRMLFRTYTASQFIICFHVCANMCARSYSYFTFASISFFSSSPPLHS